MPKSTQWTGAGHDGLWADAANWSAGVPTFLATASFTGGNFGTISLADGGRPVHGGRIEFLHSRVTLAGGTLHLNDGGSPDQQLNLVMANSILTVAAGAVVDASGSVEIEGQTALIVNGTLRDASASIGAGAAAGMAETVTVAGAGARWDGTGQLYVGGGGRLAISAGGQVDGGTFVVVGDGSASVSGPGSALAAGTVEVGNGVQGALSITGGAGVTDTQGIIGNAATTSVLVSGAGSSWLNLGGIELGDGPEQASLTIVDGGTVTGALSVGGMLQIDHSAVLSPGGIELDGGTIDAIPPPGATTGGDVVLAQQINLFAGSDGTSLDHLASVPGTRLVMQGLFQESPFLPEGLQVSGGDVALENGHNQIDGVQIGPGVLELGASGAAGAGTISFLADGAGTLALDAGVSVANPIAGLYAGDTIATLGLAAGPHDGLAWTPNTNSPGGLLSVTNGSATENFTLTDGHPIGGSAGFTLGATASGALTVGYDGPPP